MRKLTDASGGTGDALVLERKCLPYLSGSARLLGEGTVRAVGGKDEADVVASVNVFVVAAHFEGGDVDRRRLTGLLVVVEKKEVGMLGRLYFYIRLESLFVFVVEVERKFV